MSRTRTFTKEKTRYLTQITVGTDEWNEIVTTKLLNPDIELTNEDRMEISEFLYLHSDAYIETTTVVTTIERKNVWEDDPNEWERYLRKNPRSDDNTWEGER